MKYTTREIQQIIDDLDYAKTFFDSYEVEGERHPEQDTIAHSLRHASQILNDLPDEAIEGLDKKFN